MADLDAPKKFNIIVVGAGVSGLAAALGFHQKGHTVTVFERHPDTQALGGPINLSSSATSILIEYGLEELVRERLKQRPSYLYFRRFEDGKELVASPPGNTDKLYGSEIWTASRYGWQKLFKEVAEQRGIKINFSSPIQTLDANAATVVLRDGRRFEADLVVAADGNGSIIRPIILGEHVARRNPVGAFNIDVPLSIMREDPELSMLANGEQSFWQGPGGCCATIPMNDRDTYNMCWITEEKLGREGEWFVKGDLASVLERYKGWDPRLLKLVKIAKPEDCYLWNITDLPPLPTWSKGRTVLIGDAAHACLPYLGMGATASIEDGRSLAECLDRAKAVDDIPRVLKAFESLRKVRAETVIEMSRASMSMWHLPDGEKQAERDAMYESMPALMVGSKPWDGKPVDDPPKGFGDPLFNPYMRGHKVVEYVGFPSHLYVHG